MVLVSSSVRMGLRCPSWREVHPSCGGQWCITQEEEMHHTWLFGMVSQLCLTSKGWDALAKRGTCLCFAKAEGFIESSTSFTFPVKDRKEHLVHTRLIFLSQSMTTELLFSLILSPKNILFKRREREGWERVSVASQPLHPALQSPDRLFTQPLGSRLCCQSFTSQETKFAER